MQVQDLDSMEPHAHTLTGCINISMLTTNNIMPKLEQPKKTNGMDHAYIIF